MVVFECEVCGNDVHEDNVRIVTEEDESGYAFCSYQCIAAWAQAKMQMNNVMRA